MYDLTPFQAKVAASLAALPPAPAPKELLLIGKAIEATTPAVAVSDVVAAAANGVTSINGAGGTALSAIDASKTAATGAVGTARSGALTDLEAARAKAIQDVQNAGGGSNTAAGVSFAPGGGISSSNLQAALAELDSEATKRAANLSDLADAAAARQNLGLALGSQAQAYHANLQALSGLAGAANKVPYFTGAGALTLADFSSYGRSLVAGADAVAVRGTLGLGSAALLTAGAAAGNVPVLDAGGKLLASLMPALAITDVFPVATQAAMLALTAQRGDVAVRTDQGVAYILATDDPTVLGNWTALPMPAGVVMQIAGLSGPSITAAQLKTALALAIADVTGLQAALDAKAAASYATASDIWAGTDTGKIVTAKALRDAQVPQPLTPGASIAWNAALGFNAKVTLSANATFQTPTNLVEGLAYVLRVKQDATGSRTGSYSSAFNFGAAGAPTLTTTAAKEDVLTFLCTNATAGSEVLDFIAIQKGY